MEAAKRKTFWLSLIALACVFSTSAIASSVDVSHLKTRAELSSENGQFSVEPWTLNPVNATRYYDWLREAASDSSVAPVRGVAPAKRMTGETVLGRYPDYVKLSEKLGARRFEVPMEHWNRMTKAEQWAANQKFLDRTILRGDTIRLASPPSAAKPGTWFHRELRYLYERGYTLDGMKLVPGEAQ